jgi:methionyl-tRNA formyltransferase
MPTLITSQACVLIRIKEGGKETIMKVVFMGTPSFAVPTLEALLESEFSVIGVVTQPDRPRGRGQTLSASPVKELAQAHGLPILQPEKMKQPEFLKELEQWKPDVIVVTAFGRILPKIILHLPPRGCLNVHASLLPRYRGAAPIQWAIINGESETGLTTMLMDEGMDTGAILLQEPVPIDPEETAGELSVRLAHIGGRLLIETLRGWTSQKITPIAQDGSKATMAPLLKKEDGNLPWNRKALEIANRIRGLSPWPGAYTFCQEERLTIWKGSPFVDPEKTRSSDETPGTIINVGKENLLVRTGDGFLSVTEIQPANRKRMPVSQFVSGHRVTRGMKLTSGPHLE